VEALSEWVRRLVLLVLVLSFLELLAPPNGLKKCVRLVAGFLVLTAVMEPLVALVRGGDVLRQVGELAGLSRWDGRADRSRTAPELAQADQQLRNDLFARRVAAYLERALAGEAGGRVGVAVRVEPSGALARITLTAPPGQGPRLRRRAAALAGVAEKRILVVEEAIP
jgi:stage III sporulation protein AF